MRGGKEPALRLRGTLPALAALSARRLLPHGAGAALADAYRFLRNVEHRLQYRDDRQTQQLPTDDDERALLAEAMDFASAGEFEGQLDDHRRQVGAHFALVLGENAHPRPQDDDDDLFAGLWEDPPAADVACSRLAAAGFRDPAELLSTLRRAREGTRYLQLPALSRQRFDRLVPELLRIAATEAVPDADPQILFQRLFALLEAVSRRSAYLALVVEHPPLLPRLFRVFEIHGHAEGRSGRRPRVARGARRRAMARRA